MYYVLAASNVFESSYVVPTSMFIPLNMNIQVKVTIVRLNCILEIQVFNGLLAPIRCVIVERNNISAIFRLNNIPERSR